MWHQFQERSWVQVVETGSCKKQGKTTYNKPIVVQPFPWREFNAPDCLSSGLVLLSTLFDMPCLLWSKCSVFKREDDHNAFRVGHGFNLTIEFSSATRYTVAPPQTVACVL